MKLSLVKVFCLVITAIISVGISFSQELKFDHISVSEGLSQANIWDIKQDRLGFIWVATEDGLNKFDGITFTVYKGNKEDTLGISDNSITSIAEDKDGFIWVATRKGLNKYDRSLDRFERFFHRDEDPQSLAHNSVSNVFVDSKNNVWACTNNGLSFYDRQTNSFQTFRKDPDNPNSLVDDFVKCIAEDSQGILWVGTKGGLSKLAPQTRTFTNYVVSAYGQDGMSSDLIMSIMVDKSDHVWLGSFERGLMKLNSSTEKFKAYYSDPLDPTALVGPYIYNVVQNPKTGEIWVANDGALCLLDVSIDGFKRFFQDPSEEHSLNSNTVTDVYFDQTDRMLVVTRFGGINVYDAMKYQFNHITSEEGKANTLSNVLVQGMSEDLEGNIWIGIDGGGLNKYNPRTGEITHYRHDPYNDNSLQGDKILNVIVDQTGLVWTGMWDKGITTFDPKTNTYKRYLSDPNDPKSISDNNIFDFYIDHDGDLWIATWGNGINRYDRETDSFTRYSHNADKSNTIGNSPVVVITQDYTGTFWLGTEDEGIYFFDKDTEEFTQIKGGEGQGELSSGGIHSFYEDSKKRFWIGTSGAGLNLYNRADKSFTLFSEEDGLPNGGVVGIQEDGEGNLWLSTNKGISKFDPDNITFKNYSLNHGLQDDQFSRWASLKSRAGVLYFGGTNGLNHFDPKMVKDNRAIPPIYITDFKMFNEVVPIGSEILNQNILFTDKISLNYDQSFISFGFRALNYRQAEENQYKYRMKGLQDDWVDIGAERKVSFTNLSPGNYVFQVIGSNNDGYWNEEGKSLVISISPPWWVTWWFRVLAVIVVGLTAYALIRWRLRFMQKQKEKLEAMVESRTAEVKEMITLIKENSEKLTASGKILKDHAGQLAADARKQSENAKTIEHNVEEVTNNTKMTSENASQTNHLAEEVVVSLKDIKDATELNIEEIKSISNKITVLEELFRLTNILSLNASIEAARQGSNGKGFSVIAGEVRKLAERSKEASQEIVGSAKKGAVETEKVGTMLSDFVPKIERSSELISGISVATEEQRATIETINSTLKSFFIISQQNSENSEKIFEISKELDNQASVLNDKVSSLNL